MESWRLTLRGRSLLAKFRCLRLQTVLERHRKRQDAIRKFCSPTRRHTSFLSFCEQQLLAAKARLVDLGNQFCPRMHQRGGGVVDITVRKITPRRIPSEVGVTGDRPSYLVVHVHVDVCEAMGANVVNTVVEGLAPLIAEITRGRIGLRILSNLCEDRLARASFAIPVEKLGFKGVPGAIVAEKIVEAYHFAEDDPHRATTSNKGIMNGIDAVALATGQDWRAIEAAAHAYGVQKRGFYGSFTRYWLEERSPAGTRVLCGELELPMSVGTRGGVTGIHPMVQANLRLLGNPDVKTLAMILVSVGLVQNFGALRALSTEGIQRGHMSLHARNVAITAGVPADLVLEIAGRMAESNKVTVEEARSLLGTLTRSRL